MTGTSLPDQEVNDHSINIQDRLNLMNKKISEPPKLLSKAAGKSSCCIFRVPKSFLEINGKSYQPQIVSIGPYHHGQANLRLIEEHKWRYLGSMLSRIQAKGLYLEDLLEKIHGLDCKAKECYSESIEFDSDEFVEMLVVDSCFVIELFRKVGKIVEFEPDDPIVTTAWIIPFFYRDLLRLENQIPFFVLECLFDLTRMPGEGLPDDELISLSMLALNFFNYAFQRPDQVLAKYRNLKGRHLLDLVHSSFTQFAHTQSPPRDDLTPTHIIHCVSKLRRAGIKFKAIQEDTFLSIKFRNGVIEMPTVTIDDTMSSFLLNCVAYEQCHSTCSKYFTTYATFLDCLVNTFKDVEYLNDNNVFENYFGTDAEVARFINNLGKEVAFDIERCYLAKLFNDVHQHYKSSWHVQWASFKYTYFDTPWSFISALAAFVLLVLTIVQTLYTVLSYY